MFREELAGAAAAQPQYVGPPQRPRIAYFQRGADRIETSSKLHDWLMEFESECRFLKIIDPAQKAECLKVCGGSIFQKIDKHISITGNHDDEYAELVAKIKSIYASSSFKHAARDAFLNRKQGPEEDFMDFYLDCSALIDRCEYEPEERRKNLWQQLVYRTSMQKVREYAFRDEPTLEQLINYAQTLLSTYEESRAVATDQSSEVKRVQAHQVDRERKCYRCNSTQHIASFRKCPAMGKTCSKCGKLNHFSSACNKTSAQGANRHYSRKSFVKNVSQMDEADIEEEEEITNSFVRHIQMNQ